MSYTPKLVRRVDLKDGFEASVLFVNDTDASLTFQQSFIASNDADLDAQVWARIDKATNTDPTSRAIGDAIAKPAAVVVDPPSKDDEDRIAYFAAKSRALNARHLHESGRQEVTQQIVDAEIAAWNALRYDAAWEGLS